MFSILDNKLADIGYYINLDSSIERNNFIIDQATNFNISNLHRFSALSDELIQYSCTKSHRAIFELCLSNNIESAFIAEDDFVLNDRIPFLDKTILLSDYLQSIQNFNDYDVLMLGCNPKKWLIPENQMVAKNLSSTGAWAYIIKSRAMRFILDNYNYRRDYSAIDDILPSLNGKGFRTLVTIPQIADHRDGIPSTLQPHVGITSYSTWINGSWQKFLYDDISDFHDLEISINNKYYVPKKLTIVITGHSAPNWLFYLRHLLKSMPSILNRCHFIVCYDSFSYDDKYTLSRYFRDIKSEIQPSIEYVTGGLISSLKKVLTLIKTDYFLWLEHDWVFLHDQINFLNIIKAMDQYDFINSVWFNKDDNNLRSFDICHYDQKVTPYLAEPRVEEIDLITTCRWSNNPAIHRTSKIRELFDKYLNNEYVDQINQRSHNIEEKLIEQYRLDISLRGWESVKDEWGTYLYGKIGDDSYVGHTDATQRYQGISKSKPEINGENYIKNNPLKSNE